MDMLVEENRQSHQGNFFTVCTVFNKCNILIYLHCYVQSSTVDLIPSFTDMMY